jgi:hypothetical protein
MECPSHDPVNIPFGISCHKQRSDWDFVSVTNPNPGVIQANLAHPSERRRSGKRVDRPLVIFRAKVLSQSPP